MTWYKRLCVSVWGLQHFISSPASFPVARLLHPLLSFKSQHTKKWNTISIKKSPVVQSKYIQVKTSTVCFLKIIPLSQNIYTLGTKGSQHNVSTYQINSRLHLHGVKAGKWYLDPCASDMVAFWHTL